jgi:putative DNA primase/helicase
VKLSEVLATIEALKKVGTGWSGRCPSHQDDQASLSINVSDQRRLLMHCHAGCSFGDVVNALGLQVADLAVIEVDNTDITMVSPNGPQPPTFDMVQAVTQYCRTAAEHFEGSPAAVYAWERFGITSAMATQLGLGYDDGTIDGPNLSKDKYHDSPRLVVPFRRGDGIIVGLQSRRLTDAPSPKWCGPYNQGGHAWSATAVFDVNTDDADLIITEGPADALTAFASGTSSIGIRGAALAGNTKAREALEVLCSNRRVLLAGDADNAGQDFNKTLGEWLAAQDLQVHELKILHGGDLSEWREVAGAQWREQFAAQKRNAPRITGETTPTAPPARESVADHPWLFMDKTDDHNARAFIKFIGNNWSFCKALGWLCYSNGSHRPDEMETVHAQLAAMFDEMLRIGRLAAEEGREIGGHEGELLEASGNALVNHARQSLNQPRFGHALKQARYKRPVSFGQLDQHDHLLCASNVTVDLRDGSTIEHSAEHWITTGLAVAYDPDAKCPKWDQFLRDITLDRPELIHFMQTLIGYGITGRTSEQVLAILVGGGSNGKSVFGNVLRRVFEPITEIASFTAFEKKQGGSGSSDLAQLAGARMVWASEGERQAPIQEALIKRVTGADPITCRHLYMKEFTYVPKFLLLLGTNYQPNISGQDLGIWRRMLLIPFDAVFQGEARNLFIEDELMDEAEGILAWCCDGAKRWYAEGLQIPEIIRSKVDDYQKDSDALGGFIGVSVTATPPKSQDSEVPTVAGNDLYEAYKDWQFDEGGRQMSRKALYAAVLERLPEVYKHHGRDCVMFYNCALNARRDG